MSPQTQQVSYKVAEVFDSIQGEGQWTGTPMRFIRLAGCNVGKPAPTSGSMIQLGADVRSPEYLRAKHPEHTICKGWDGDSFLCDTDYGAKDVLTIEQLLDSAKLHHICITGGEPFIHDLGPLVLAAQLRRIHVHIETSGTRLFNLPPTTDSSLLWITCAPKHGFLFNPDQASAISEIKLVVGPQTAVARIIHWICNFRTACLKLPHTPIYLQPITNNVGELDKRSMDRVMEIALQHPWLRVCLQTHKVWGVR